MSGAEWLSDVVLERSREAGSFSEIRGEGREVSAYPPAGGIYGTEHSVDSACLSANAVRTW